MNTQLDYSIYENQDATPGITDYSIMVTVTNNSVSTINLRYFQIYIPVGDGDNDLTPTDDTSSIIGNTQESWNSSLAYDATGEYFVVTFAYSNHAGCPINPGISGLNFGIDNITVNNCPGIFTCKLYEYTTSQNTGIEYDFSFDKPNSPTPVSFYTNTLSINCGDKVVIYWSGPSGWTYDISYGNINLLPTTDNESSQIVSITESTWFSLLLKKTGENPLGPYQFRVEVSPSINFIGIPDINNMQLAMTWTTQGATSVYSTWGNEEPIALDGSYTATLPPIDPTSEQWGSSAYQLTVNGIDTQVIQTCDFPAPSFDSPPTLEYDVNDNSIVLSWSFLGAFYVKGSWTSDSTIFKPTDTSIKMYPPFAPIYTVTAYLLNDVATEYNIDTASYFPAPIINKFAYSLGTGVLNVSWNVEPANANSPVSSVYGSWQNDQSTPLPATGTQTLHPPFASSYTLTANSLFSGNTTQQSFNLAWIMENNIQVKYAPWISCIAPNNNTCILGFLRFEDNQGTITFLDGANIISNGRLVNQIQANANNIGFTTLLATSDGNTLFRIEGNTAFSYDINTTQLIGTYPIPANANAALTPDNSFLYAANMLKIVRINLATGESDSTYMHEFAGSDITFISITPDGEYVFIGVGNNVSGNGYIVPILVQSNTLLPSVVLENINPCAIAFTPNNQYALVVSDRDNTVSVIELSSLSVTATIPVGANPKAIAVTPNGQYVFVANSGTDTVSVLDANTFILVQTIQVDSGPISIAIAPDSNYAIVLSETSMNVSFIQVETFSIVLKLHVCNQTNNNFPHPTFSPDGNSLYIPCMNNNGESVMVLKPN